MEKDIQEDGNINIQMKDQDTVWVYSGSQTVISTMDSLEITKSMDQEH